MVLLHELLVLLLNVRCLLRIHGHKHHPPRILKLLHLRRLLRLQLCMLHGLLYLRRKLGLTVQGLLARRRERLPR